MADRNGFNIFGLRFGKNDLPDERNIDSIESIIPREIDGSIEIEREGVRRNQFNFPESKDGIFSIGVEFDASFNSQKDRINYFRTMARNSYVGSAIDDIVNEAIAKDSDETIIDINLDNTNFSDKIKDRILEEFKEILYVMDFSNAGSDIFRQWYVDGMMYIHLLVDKDNLKDGIRDMRLIDPRKIKKITEVTKDKTTGLELRREEYYMYFPAMDVGKKTGKRDESVKSYRMQNPMSKANKAVRLTKDSVIYVWSGLLDVNDNVVSYLDDAIIPYNQLNSLEEALLIYRMSRSSEKRLFNIEVGDLPKTKAEGYISNLIDKYKNKTTYDPSTGEINNQSQLMTMFQDFWLPQKNGKGTQISTIGGTSGVFVTDDELQQFLKKLYKGMRVPFSRYTSEGGGVLGNQGQEISRDEIKFYKFISKLRARFSNIFTESMKTQLILKNIISADEWEENVKNITFTFTEDSLFFEMKEMDILQSRIEVLDKISQYTVGGADASGGFINTTKAYFDKEYVQKKILRMSDEEIRDMEKRIEEQSAEIEKKMPKEPPSGGPFG